MDITGEWELNPEEIAAIYRTKGWNWHLNGGLYPPRPEDIDAMLRSMIEEVVKNPETVGVQRGRLLVFKDDELPNSYDIFLNVGYVWDDEALGEDGELV